MNDRTKKIAALAVCASLAMILSYLELLLPPLAAGFPAIKMGLANIVIIFALFKFGIPSAAAVSVVRLALCALLFGNAVTFVYSFAGAVLSLLVMSIAKKIRWFSAVGVSLLGGVFHNVGQILAAGFLMDTAAVGYYFPVLAVSGTVSGIFIGCIGAFVLKTLRNVKI